MLNNPCSSSNLKAALEWLGGISTFVQEESRVQFKSAHGDEADKVQSLDNMADLILILGSQPAGSVDLAGITVPCPHTSSPNSEGWLSKDIWPHQNLLSVHEFKADEVVFSLSAQGSSDAEPLICMVPSGAQQLSNGTLELRPNAAIVLDDACSGFCFKDMKVQGKTRRMSKDPWTQALPYIEQSGIVQYNFRAVTRNVLVIVQPYLEQFQEWSNCTACCITEMGSYLGNTMIASSWV